MLAKNLKIFDGGGYAVTVQNQVDCIHKNVVLIKYRIRCHRQSEFEAEHSVYF